MNAYIRKLEHKKQLSERMKNRTVSEETKEKLRIINTGKTLSEETKEKISLSNKGKPAHNKGKNISEEHRKNISKGSKGKLKTEEHKNNISKAAIRDGRKPPPKAEEWELSSHGRSNMIFSKLRYDLDRNWFNKFDPEKITLLNRCIMRERDYPNKTTEFFISYIEKFYYDETFNYLYNNWVKYGKKSFMRPSIDHIIPKSKGGTNDLNNLKFVTWLENKCKGAIEQKEWDEIKSEIDLYFSNVSFVKNPN